MNGPALLKCICDETRFEILELLQKDDELCVNDFVEELKKDQPLVSHHLKTLKQCGIVKSRNEGKKTMYSISNPQLSTLISTVTKTSKKIPTLCTDEKCC
jgi:DNA-binding transcriptional ArsR family regulator|tara:strand:+ start:181 stop:480 length:300 start_codon:yes stop_codon:yes gene_type:complete